MRDVYKVIAGVGVVLLLIGLFAFLEPEAENTGKKAVSGDITFQEICLDGVIYYYKRHYHTAALSPKIDQMGNIFHCD